MGWCLALKGDLTFLSVPWLPGDAWCQSGSVTNPLTRVIWAVFALGVSPEPGQERWNQHLASQEVKTFPLCVLEFVNSD